MVGKEKRRRAKRGRGVGMGDRGMNGEVGREEYRQSDASGKEREKSERSKMQ